MQTIIVNYYELVDDANGKKVQSPLGRELFEDIGEALVPTSASYKVFFVKKFTGSVNYRWFVESVVLTSPLNATAAIYTVVLSKTHSLTT